MHVLSQARLKLRFSNPPLFPSRVRPLRPYDTQRELFKNTQDVEEVTLRLGFVEYLYEAEIKALDVEASSDLRECLGNMISDERVNDPTGAYRDLHAERITECGNETAVRRHVP